MFHYRINSLTHPASVSLFCSKLRNRGFEACTDDLSLNLITNASLAQIHEACGESGWIEREIKHDKSLTPRIDPREGYDWSAERYESYL
jgi:hypothetical protein